MSDLNFSKTFCLKYFFILTIIYGDMIKNIFYLPVQKPLVLSDINETILEKYAHYNPFSWS
jgi:hypothetical protein